ncbi:hypothetical protein GFS24_15250 [Chitinophaga sp. SYP-B3965]|uniref:hypothetical protein n=1 Tax=Chitinophaga sp. SYP-B3965 TaxID=2663120 RepID=UPI00129974D6|nr:hypothetical protein [Chitinophaga sp. SYP-B3965]MRG46478.1 hypothetical protein [Chitinophaga sp. SYP-B3965]
MKSNYLLPHIYKKIGWFITIPLFFIGLIFFPLNDTLEIFRAPSWFDSFPGEYSDEVISAGLIIGMLLVAFSREKIEDEYINKIRLESLQISVLINYLLLIICILVVYNMDFLAVMAYNMFTILLLFIIRFNFIIYRNK